ncbi:MAG: replication-relaxation family protein, partial [bacterium]
MTRRASRRHRRAEKCALRLTKRDPWILEDLAKMRFATTGQLARLHFGESRSAANKRLRRLLDAGLVRVWVPRLDGENIYGLASPGMRLLGESDPRERSAPRGLDGNIAHLLAVNSVRVAIAVTIGELGAELDWWRSYWELDACFKEPVIPDALFRVRVADRHQVFALELDRTTPAPKAFLRRILNYEAMGGRGYGVSELAILIVGSHGWLERYRLLVAQHPLRIPLWFASLSDIVTEGALASWRSVRGDLVPSLRALL